MRRAIHIILAASCMVAGASRGGTVPPAQSNPERFNSAASAVSTGAQAIHAGVDFAGRELHRSAGEIAAREAANWTQRGALNPGTAKEIRSAARAEAAAFGSGVNGVVEKGAPRHLGTIANVAGGANALNKALDGDFAGAAEDSTDLIVSNAAEPVAIAALKATGRIAADANVACPHCGLAFEAGYQLGDKVINKIDTCAWRDCGPGKTRLVEDVVTDAWFSAYEKVKFTISPELDPMSDEFEAAARAKAIENRRRFETRASELQDLQRERDDAERAARAAAARRDADSASGGSTFGAFNDVLGAMLTTEMIQRELERGSEGSESGDVPPYDSGFRGHKLAHSGHPGASHGQHEEQCSTNFVGCCGNVCR
jgi:hypothetical protein